MANYRERPRRRKRINETIKQGKITLIDIAYGTAYDESHRKQAKKMLLEQMGLPVVNGKKTTIFGRSTKAKRYIHLAASCFLPIREI